MRPPELVTLYPAIRERIVEVVASAHWPELKAQIDRHLTATPLPVHLVVPLASAAAVGGEPEAALSVSASCGFLLVGLRWLDDLADRDREGLWSEIGEGRTLGFATAALTLASHALVTDERLPRAVSITLGEQLLALGRGQEADLQATGPRDLGEVREIARAKTGAGVAFACRAGALAGGADATTALALGRFGEHLGIALQALDDLDGCFHPDGIGDLASGKVTLAVAYGLAADHPHRDELAALVAAGRLGAESQRVRALLDRLDTREHLVGTALAERRAALAILAALPAAGGDWPQVGREALATFADHIVADWRQLLTPTDRAPARLASEYFQAGSAHA
jgi:geranylgeranyl diphosphate synthase, type I